eukprot:13733947-Alexandrium_andersonii.AAC.1
MVIRCAVERIGLGAVIERFSRVPQWTRVQAEAWGPFATWSYYMREIGMQRVRDGGLKWAAQPGNQACPQAVPWE